MPWFGQGGKKNKSPATTELQSQKAKQIDSLRNGTLNVTESIKDVEYRVNFHTSGTSISLIVSLPPQFPQDKPDVKVEPAIRHPWVDQHMKVTGCPNINNFSVHSSLNTAIQAIVEEFMSRPPVVVSQSHFSSPGARGYPSPFPMTTNIFNMYPSMPPLSSLAQSSDTEVTSSQSQEAISSPPPTSSSSNIPDISQMDVLSMLPDLKNKSHMQLMEILEEEDKILEVIQALPQLQEVVKEREKISCRCTELAKENLNQKPVIEDLKRTVREKVDQFERLRDEFERNQEKQLSLMDQFHPTVIQNNLKVAIMEADEESDRVVEDFLDKKINIEEFQQQFLEKRTLYHTRRAKEEKMNHMSFA